MKNMFIKGDMVGAVMKGMKASEYKGVKFSVFENDAEAAQFLRTVEDNQGTMADLISDHAANGADVGDGARGLGIVAPGGAPYEPVTQAETFAAVAAEWSAKLAAVRERLAFELTEYLVGSHELSEAIINVIRRKRLIPINNNYVSLRTSRNEARNTNRTYQ